MLTTRNSMQREIASQNDTLLSVRYGDNEFDPSQFLESCDPARVGILCFSPFQADNQSRWTRHLPSRKDSVLLEGNFQFHIGKSS